MRLAIATLSGGLFGSGLFLAGMTDTRKVIGWLDIFGDWDPTLAFVLGGAVIPMALAWRLAQSRTPLLADAFPRPPSRHIDSRLIGGSILFGVGWGLVGLCPGPALASITYGGQEGLLFLAAMGAGMALAGPVLRRLDRRATVA